MAKVYPFCGLRYNNQKIQNIQELIAPPYDVVTKSIRDKFLLASPYNIFHLELPKEDKKNNRNKYEHASFLLKQWRKESIIIRDPLPCIYVYNIEFKVDNKYYTRQGIVALVRVEPWETRIIRPHEKTFNKVTNDRLCLLEHTKTQFSQVFLLYKGNKKAGEILKDYSATLLYELKDYLGNTHRLSSISDIECAKRLHNLFKDLPMYIADGHHRYTTALNFSQKMKKILGDEPWRAYNYLMVYMVDVDDPGLLVLPTHRIVSLSNHDNVLNVIAKSKLFFDTKIQEVSNIDQIGITRIKESLNSLRANTSFAVFYKEHDKIVSEIWTLKDSVFEELISTIPKPLAQLDVTILNEIVFSKIIQLDIEKEHDLSKISFTPDDNKLLTISDTQLFFMLNATKPEEVLRVSDEGLVMPHKSTFFYPKILTGLVMNSVSENDKVYL